MTRTLSPTQNAIFSAGWALVTALILLVLASSTDFASDSVAVFCVLVLLGPTISALLCDRLRAVAFGALGLGAGLLVFCLIGVVFSTDYGKWGRIAFRLVPFVSFVDLVVSIPLWWCVRRPWRTWKVWTLSPMQNAIFSAGWAVMIVLILLVLASFTDFASDSVAVFCVLVLLGPTISAVFCDRLRAVAFGALGLGAGLLAFCLYGAVFLMDYGKWGRIAFRLVPLILLVDLVVSIPLWWCVRRLRRSSAPVDRVSSTDSLIPEASTMARTLSPKQNAIFSAGWALAIGLIIAMLATFTDFGLESEAAFCVLFLPGPMISAVFCDRLRALAFGALGLGAGLLVFCLIGAVFFMDHGDWGRIGLLVPLVSLIDLVVSIPLWWCVRRLRRTSAPTTATP